MSRVPEPSDNEYFHPLRRVVLGFSKLIVYLVHIYVGLTQAVLGLGFGLLLLGANPGSSFVDWAYRSVDRAMEPFRGIFTPVELGGADVASVFEGSILFAMVIYGIAAIAINAVISWLSDRQTRLDRDIRDQRNYARLFNIETAARTGQPAHTEVTSS